MFLCRGKLRAARFSSECIMAVDIFFPNARALHRRAPTGGETGVGDKRPVQEVALADHGFRVKGFGGARRDARVTIKVHYTWAWLRPSARRVARVQISF